MELLLDKLQYYKEDSWDNNSGKIDPRYKQHSHYPTTYPTSLEMRMKKTVIEGRLKGKS